MKSFWIGVLSSVGLIVASSTFAATAEETYKSS